MVKLAGNLFHVIKYTEQKELADPENEGMSALLNVQGKPPGRGRGAKAAITRKRKRSA